MGIEYELKFRATEAQLEQIRKDYPQTWQRLEMETTYYDTRDGALSARFFTLRRRLENGRGVCTLKVPAEKGRGEWELEAEDLEQAIPELCKLGAPAELVTLTKDGIVPTCGARFTRLANTLSWESGVLELALDRGYLSGGDRREAFCEVEVELKSGKPEDADLFARLLAARYGLSPQPASKFRRALALLKGE